MAALIVFLQQVQAEIAVKVAPNGMNVIGVILRVVELDQKLRRLDTIVVGLARLLAARPREVDVIAGLLDSVIRASAFRSGPSCSGSIRPAGFEKSHAAGRSSWRPPSRSAGRLGQLCVMLR